MDNQELHGEELVPQRKPQRKRRQKPTIRQIKALQLMQQGNSVRGALKKAGYSFGTYNASTKFFKKEGVRQALESMRAMMDQYGLSNEKYVEKLLEFVDAREEIRVKGVTIGEKPDYKTQVEGFKLWTEIRNEEKAPKGTKKREMTITEFITGEEEK